MEKTLVLLHFIVLGCLCRCSRAIYGGRPANIQQTPYAAQCTSEIDGGLKRFASVIIDQNLVLTLAYYCEEAVAVLVYPGLTDLSDGEGSLQIVAINIHPNYNKKTDLFNFCVMKAERGFTYGLAVQHGSLPGLKILAPNDLHSTFVVSGWGRVDNDTTLKQLELPPKMMLHEFRFVVRPSNSFVLDLVPDPRLGSVSAFDKTTFGDGGGGCMHRKSAKIFGLVVDNDKIRTELRKEPHTLAVNRQCILIGPVREWIEQQRKAINE